jgi:hypothetical protein
MRHNRLLTATLALSVFAIGCSESGDPTTLDTRVSLEITGGNDQEAVTSGAGTGHLLIGNGTMVDSLRVRVTGPNGEPLAGRSVVWSTSAGTVSPATSTTGVDGIAAAHWSLHRQGGGWSPVGTHAVEARVAATSVTASFTGHARAGVTVRSISFSPDTVDVGGGDAPVSVTVRMTDDRRDAGPTHVSVQFYNPSATQTVFQSVVQNLARVGDGGAETEWTGTVTMPDDAEAGAWSLGRLVIGWGCGSQNRGQLLADRLAELGLTYLLPVVRGPAGAPAANAGSPPPLALESATC